VPCIEQSAERANLVAEFENLVCDALRGSHDHETFEAPLRRERGIRLTATVAHHVQGAGLRELGLNHMEVEAVGAVLAMRVATRRGFFIGDEDAARHTPAGGVG